MKSHELFVMFHKPSKTYFCGNYCWSSVFGDATFFSSYEDTLMELKKTCEKDVSIKTLQQVLQEIKNSF